MITWFQLYVNVYVIPILIPILILTYLLLLTKLPLSFILKSYMPYFQLSTFFAIKHLIFTIFVSLIPTQIQLILILT